MVARRQVLIGLGALGGAAIGASAPARTNSGRPPLSERRFVSPAVEACIVDVKARVRDARLKALFETCFPNTLDTTVTTSRVDGGADTFVVTGDIDAMWLRDSSEQVRPYLGLARGDRGLQQLFVGVIARQARSILIDPYANAFTRDPGAASNLSWAQADKTEMRPGVAERKWEIDSLCHVLRLSHDYWRATDDLTPFDAAWRAAMQRVVQTFREQQRKMGDGPYRFERDSDTPLDTLSLGGFGAPTRKVGLIHSGFRPSDDACVYPFHVPGNLFAVSALRGLARMARPTGLDDAFAIDCKALAGELSRALSVHGRIRGRRRDVIWAYEVDGYGNALFMDDANIPSLLGLPYIGACDARDPLYRATRAAALSEDNPYFFKGSAGEGVGGPHVGLGMIWPMAIIMRAMTSQDDREILACLETLKASAAGTGFMHEAFDKNDPTHFTRPWFAWANALFGALILQLIERKPHLLQ